MSPHDEWTSEDEERHFITDLRTGGPTAEEAIIVRFLPLLARFLARAFPRAEADLRDTAAADAVFNFTLQPQRFDAERGHLGAYLRMAARRDLLNLLEKENRARRGVPLGSVEEPADPRNTIRDDDELAWTHPALVAELAALTADERAAVDLMRAGVRRTATFVARLGLGHLSPEEQVAEVMRLKDRVKRRLTRALEGQR